jgi:hypothetical protein
MPAAMFTPKPKIELATLIAIGRLLILEFQKLPLVAEGLLCCLKLFDWQNKPNRLGKAVLGQ